MTQQYKNFLLLSAVAAWITAAGCQNTQPTLKQESVAAPAPAMPKKDPAKIAKAKETLRELPTINNRVAQSYYDQGLYFEEQNMPAQAIGEYLKALKVKPAFSDLIFTQLGLLYAQTGQLNLAEDALLEAIKLNAESALANYQLGMVYLQKGDTAKTAQALQNAISINPNLAEAHYHLGKILWESDKPAAVLHLKQYQATAKDKSRDEEINALLNPLGTEAAPGHRTIPALKAASIQK